MPQNPDQIVPSAASSHIIAATEQNDVKPLTDDVLDLLALSLVPGLGPRLTTALIARFGSPGAVRRATAAELRGVPHIGAKLSESFAHSLAAVDLDLERQLLDRHSTNVVIQGGPDYPSGLAQLVDAPPLLFVRGEFRPADAKAVGIVGSRNCSSYGLKQAARFASGLARAGYTIISGLARGVDGAAHQAAIDASGRTIAVLAGGLSSIYPPDHVELAEAVARSGALISETPMTVAPQSGMFPARNRLISGMSLGVIIIEANAKSGALITARHAAEQGREVFVVPGQADSQYSAGSNALLRKGAKLVTEVDHVLEDLGGSPIEKAIVPEALNEPPGLDEAGRSIWMFLSDGPKAVDELARNVNRPVAQLSTLLMQLEMKKVIRRLPGSRFERR